MSTSDNQKVLCCIGAGYVGATLMGVLCGHCPDYKIVVVDKGMCIYFFWCLHTINYFADISRVDAWNSNTMPIYEPGLDELVIAGRDVNLTFTTDIVSAIKSASMIFVAVNTPLREFGSLVWQAMCIVSKRANFVQAHKAYDLSAYEAVARTIAAHATDRKSMLSNSYDSFRCLPFV